MTIDLDERWPHTAGAECSKYPVVCDRDCTRDARIAAHIERLEAQRAAATAIAVKFGNVDGAHHKQWMLDQMLCALTGDDHDAVVAAIGGWDRGIAP
jgi:hypothetical protein